MKVDEKDKTEEGFDDDELRINELVKEFPSRESISDLKIFSDKFEKDVDTNHHVDFVSCVSNLRAANYSITNVERDKVKQIAGKIIPVNSISSLSFFLKNKNKKKKKIKNK